MREGFLFQYKTTNEKLQALYAETDIGICLKTRMNSSWICNFGWFIAILCYFAEALFFRKEVHHEVMEIRSPWDLILAVRQNVILSPWLLSFVVCMLCLLSILIFFLKKLGFLSVVELFDLFWMADDAEVMCWQALAPFKICIYYPYFSPYIVLQNL